MSQKILWVPLALCFLYVLLVLIRIPVVAEKEKTEKAVEYIRTQQITVGDVLGTNLPPAPNQAQNDTTLVGIDANKNGIRDDVELKLFSSTPNVRIRAAELQYLRAKQLALTNVFNSDTWVAFAVQENRAYQCLGQALRETGMPEDDLIPTVEARVENLTALTLDTQLRKDAYERNMHFITGYVLDRSHVCDISPDLLQN